MVTYWRLARLSEADYQKILPAQVRVSWSVDWVLVPDRSHDDNSGGSAQSLHWSV